MRIEWWPTDRPKPYPNNPRINDDAVQGVADSLRAFGWQQPIVVDKDGVVIVGHTRLKAAKTLGMDKVPVTVASDLTPDEVAAYRLADNRTAEKALWDMDALKLELKGIQLDMSLWFDGTDWSNGGVDGFSPEYGEDEPLDADAAVTVKVTFKRATEYQKHRDAFAKMERDGATVSVS